MVAAGNIKPEACAYIVDYKQHTVTVAELAHLLPLFPVGKRIIVEITVIVRLCDKRRHISAAFIVCPLHSVGIKPRQYNIIGDIVCKNTRVICPHSPRVVAVIIALKEKDFFLAGVRPCTKHRKGCSVGSVLHKVRPVGGSYGIDKQLGALYHLVGRRGSAVALFKLFERRGVNIGVVITEHIRTVGAHKVEIAVAVGVPKICTLGTFAYQRPFFKREKKSLARSQMSVYSGRYYLKRTVKPRAAFLMRIFRISAHFRFLLSFLS